MNTHHVFYIGDVLGVLRTLPNESVHCVVTSPPYWGLRDYGVPGQIGLERTPEEYVERLVEVFREVRRVIRRDGTLWLNLGDCYATGAGKVGKHPGGGEQGARWKGYRGTRPGGPKHAEGAIGPMTQPNRLPQVGLKPKDLVGVPWMTAFALRAEGWWLRDDIIWAKGVSGEACRAGWSGNPMPESVRDRPTRAHEYVFLMSPGDPYWYDGDAIREPYASSDEHRSSTKWVSGWATDGEHHPVAHARPKESGDSKFGVRGRHAGYQGSQMGRNIRDVWTISPQPFPEAHFATFPEALVEWCILAGTSQVGCCSVCGAPYRRIVDHIKSRVEQRRYKAADAGAVGRHRGLPERPGRFVGASATTTGWAATCNCGAGVTPCIVLDPFGGSGTVSLVAKRLGRSSVYIDLNPSYVEMAVRRCGPWNQPRLDGEDTYEVVDLRRREEAAP